MANSYTRIGAQIVAFLQTTLSQPITLPKPVGLKHKAENVQMPGASIDLIEAHIRKKIAELRHQPKRRLNNQKLAKYFGKFLPKLKLCNRSLVN